MNCNNQNFTTIDDAFLKSYQNKNNRKIKLEFRGNKLRETPNLSRNISGNLTFLYNVTQLDLSYNKISSTYRDVVSINLEVLKLDNNNISHIDTEVLYKFENPTLKELSLHNNPWICDCDAISLIEFINKNHEKIFKLLDISCNGTRLKVMNRNSSEPCLYVPKMIFQGILCLGTILGILTVFYKLRETMKISLFFEKLFTNSVTEEEIDKDKKYDAFISYSHKDQDFVLEEIVKKLEEGPEPYKLCLHYRDWLAGELYNIQCKSYLVYNLVKFSPFFKKYYCTVEIIFLMDRFFTKQLL